MTLDELEAVVLELRARVAALEFDAIPVPPRRAVVEVPSTRPDPRRDPLPPEVLASALQDRIPDKYPVVARAANPRQRRSSSQQVIRQHVDVAQHLERIKAHASDALEALAEGSRIAVVADKEEQ